MYYLRRFLAKYTLNYSILILRMKANTIKIWFNIHKWTSLICTIFLLLLCLTGLPLIFTDEIHDLMDKDPDAPVISAQIKHVSIDQVIENAEAHLPGKSVKYIFRDENKEPGKLFFTLGDTTQNEKYWRHRSMKWIS
jgi:uncharacterized iron-regulated membrane protein